MTNSMPARHQGNQVYEIVERRLVGDAEYIGSITNRLTEHGVLVWASKLRFDPAVGSYALIRYRTDQLVDAPPARPATTALAITGARAAEPSTSIRQQRWFKPVVITASIAVVVALIWMLILWSVNQIQQLSSIKLGSGAVGLVLCLALVGWLVSAATKKKKGMGYHYGPCE